jgi:hypothetical protein
VPDISKRELDIRSFESIKLGQSRDLLKEEFVLEASYRQRLLEDQNGKGKGKEKTKVIGKTFECTGISILKVLKFLA